MLIGARWREGGAQAQSARVRTERHGELLFIRSFKTRSFEVECILGTDATGICERCMAMYAALGGQEAVGRDPQSPAAPIHGDAGK
jgi:hypothetical protein